MSDSDNNKKMKPNILKGVRKVKKKMDETYNSPSDINVWKKAGMFDFKESDDQGKIKK